MSQGCEVLKLFRDSSQVLGAPDPLCEDSVEKCNDTADTNDDGGIDIGDGIYLLQYLFANGPPIPAPHVACGIDASPDGLDCTAYLPCAQ